LLIPAEESGIGRSASPSGPELAGRLGRPVVVDNDTNLGALGEFVWGAGRGTSTMAYFKAATGIGGGLLIDGRLLHGAAGISARSAT
jgi:predicted NBD/HSP70 family sugar kinase